MKTPSAASSFKGNKQSLPSKPCVACGRPMTWRKRWAKNWDEVKFCSDTCRKARAAGSVPAPAATSVATPAPASSKVRAR